MDWKTPSRGRPISETNEIKMGNNGVISNAEIQSFGELHIGMHNGCDC